MEGTRKQQSGRTARVLWTVLVSSAAAAAVLVRPFGLLWLGLGIAVPIAIYRRRKAARQVDVLLSFMLYAVLAMGLSDAACFIKQCTASYYDPPIYSWLIFLSETLFSQCVCLLVALYIYIKYSQERITRLAITSVGAFAAGFVPMMLLLNWYNCELSGYVYEADYCLPGWLLLKYAGPAAFAAVLLRTFFQRTAQKSLGRRKAVFGIIIIIAVCAVLWLFFPRCAVTWSDGRNPFYFDIRLVCRMV